MILPERAARVEAQARLVAAEVELIEAAPRAARPGNRDHRIRGARLGLIEVCICKRIIELISDAIATHNHEFAWPDASMKNLSRE